MALNITPEVRKKLEEDMAKAEPYDDDDPILDQFDGDRDDDRMMATIAKNILEGRL